jgi:hypothetical protein
MASNSETARVYVHPDGRMDRKNAAKYLGFSPKTLADWATIGPRYVMVGGRVFYFQEDLDGWVGDQPRLCGSVGRR